MDFDFLCVSFKGGSKIYIKASVNSTFEAAKV